jgi:peptidoglycan hydrolase-like protein with peptidoglycan-binding domain
MGVVAARLVFLAFLGLTGCIIYNALYLQDGHGPGSGGAVASSRQAMVDPPAPVPVKTVVLPLASTDLPPLPANVDSSQLVVRAVQRELAARGLEVGPINGKHSDKTRAAIAAYQDKQGMPVTGVATDELLRHILLGDSVKPNAATGSLETQGSIGDRSEGSTVKAVQQILADLGYDPGPIDGKLGGTTARAISTFQRDRDIAETGTITPEFLREVTRITGRDLTKTASHP